MDAFKFQISTAVFVFFAALIMPVHADHVLLQDGRVLFNVTVEDSGSTATRPLRVRNRTNGTSFEYNTRTHAVKILPGSFGTHMVAAFVKTYENVGKEAAKEIVRRQNWHRYIRPERPRIVAPTPEPRRTVIPTVVAAKQKRQLPVSVIPETFPLSERLQKQLNQFVKEQSTVAFDTNTSVAGGLITPEQGVEERIRWLENQVRILKTYYPQQEPEVQAKIRQWQTMIETTRTTGKYDIE